MSEYRSTGDNLLDMVASVYRLAVRDALRGDALAIEWLNCVAPDWRRFTNEGIRKNVTTTTRRAGDSPKHGG